MERIAVFIFLKTIVMAEMIGKERKGKKYSGRNIKIDLTPMVDLGFLLITFFVFTTTMSQPVTMNIVVPNDKDSTVNDAVCESCALTVLPGKNNQLYYYEGMENNAVYKTTTYAPDGLREIIMQKKNGVKKRMHMDRLVLIIKPSVKSNFKNVIDIIDETAICQVKRYYIAELNEAERKKTE